MKRTLLITIEYPPLIGGVAHYYANLVRHLPVGEIVVLDNAKGELLSTSRVVWPKWLKGIVSTFRAIRKNNIECILVGQVLPLGVIAWIFYRCMGIPYIVATHGMDVTMPFAHDGSRRKQWLIRHILMHASAVTTVSQYTREKLITLGVPENRIVLVYPCANDDVVGVPVDQTQRDTLDERYHLQGKRVVLSVGRLIERKGFDVGIMAMAIVQKDHPDVAYVIVGDGGYRDRLRALVERLQLQDCVQIIGSVTNEELAVWYSRSTCMLMPSRELENHDVEGFGITFVEANAFGKPTIGGNSGGIPDAVIDGETGFLVNPTDVPMLTRALTTVLDNTAVAQRLGESGKKRTQEIFNWSVQAKKLEECITRL